MRAEVIGIEARVRRWATPEQTAAALPGITKQALAGWRFEAKGPRYYKVGRKVLYDLDEVFAWVESTARYGTSAEAV